MAQGQNGAATVDSFDAAHAALKADDSVQFGLPPARPPPEKPSWLRNFFDWLGDVLEPVGRFLSWVTSWMPDAPYARILLWTVIAVALLAFAWMVWLRVRTGEWRRPFARRAEPADLAIDEEWAPETRTAHAWLEEADALAADGRFAEAVHLLLFRSIDDITRRRPQLDRPALTSRELAAAEVIPSRARELFAGIARLVECSLFGGRDVGSSDWNKARSAYADFALAGAWRT